MRRLIIALVAVDLATEAFKFAGCRLAQRQREMDFLMGARAEYFSRPMTTAAYNEGISRATLIAYGLESTT